MPSEVRHIAPRNLLKVVQQQHTNFGQIMARATLSEEIAKRARLMKATPWLYRAYMGGSSLDRICGEQDFSRALLTAAFRERFGANWSMGRKKQMPGDNFRYKTRA